MSFPHTSSKKKKKNGKSSSQSRSKSKSPNKPPPLKPTTSVPTVNGKKHNNNHTYNTPPVKPVTAYRIMSPTPTNISISSPSKSKSKSKSRSKGSKSPRTPSRSSRSPSSPASPNGSRRKRKSHKTESTPLRKPKTSTSQSVDDYKIRSPSHHHNHTSSSSKKKRKKQKPKVDTNSPRKNPDIDDRHNLSPKNSSKNRHKRKGQSHSHSPRSKTNGNNNHSSSDQKQRQRQKQKKHKSEMNGNNTSSSNKGKKRISSKSKKRTFYGDLYSTKSKGKLQTLYKVKEKIGSGTFSTVRRGIRRSDKKEIAIKIITKTELNDTEARLIKREIGVMQKLDHQNIVKLYDIFETTHHLYLIIEYCRGGELFDELINCTPSGWFSEREASQIIKQIAEALQFMHSKMIIHRDLKLENILIAMKKNYQINTKQKKFSIDNAQSDIDEIPTSDIDINKHKRSKKKKNDKDKSKRSRGMSSHVVQFKSDILKNIDVAVSLLLLFNPFPNNKSCGIADIYSECLLFIILSNSSLCESL